MIQTHLLQLRRLLCSGRLSDLQVSEATTRCRRLCIGKSVVR
jgi:hypothetical protein